MLQSNFWTRNRHLADLGVVSLVAIIGAVAAFSPNLPLLLRATLALPLVFYLPGYGIVGAAIPRMPSLRLEHIIFSVGGSICVTVLVGLLLNFTVGMTVEAWTIALTSVTLMGCLLTTVRRPQYATNMTGTISAGLNALQYVTIILAVILAIVSVNLVRQAAIQAPPEDYTSFWILPVPEASNALIQVGIKNVESKVITYQVKLEVGTTLLDTTSNIVVRPGETWEKRFFVPVAQTQGKMIKASLYRVDSPSKPYRFATLWMPK